MLDKNNMIDLTFKALYCLTHRFFDFYGSKYFSWAGGRELCNLLETGWTKNLERRRTRVLLFFCHEEGLFKNCVTLSLPAMATTHFMPMSPTTPPFLIFI